MHQTYHTDGKQLLLAFLRQNTDRPRTIEEIAALLPHGKAPAKSTLYRLMNGLVEDGVVRRFVKGNSRHFTYQLLDEECRAHLHLKCVDCGRTVHLARDVSEFMETCLLKQNHFAADGTVTMVLGRCEECAEKKENA